MNNVIKLPDRINRLSKGLKELGDQFIRNYAEIRIYEDGQREVFIHADTEEAAERLRELL